jgi:hypothetical protein
MWSGVIVILAPAVDYLPCFGQAAEQMFVQALVAQAAVEAFDKSILDGFAGLDIMPRHATGNPSQDCRTIAVRIIYLQREQSERLRAVESVRSATVTILSGPQ